MAIYKKIDNQDVKVAETNIIDHNQLTGRDSYGSHPISAIRKLPEKLTEHKNAINKEIDDRQLADTEIVNKSKNISLVEKDNGNLVFTNYLGVETTVHGGYGPDNETINLQPKYYEVQLTEETYKPNTYYLNIGGSYVLDESAIFSQDKTYYEEQDRLVAFALQTSEGNLSGERIRQAITTKGGYLDSYDFGSANPSQDDLTAYALQDIGANAYLELGYLTEEQFNSYTYLYSYDELTDTYTRETVYDNSINYYTTNIWDKTRVINTYNDETWVWDNNSQSWSNLGVITFISDANNEGLHGLVTGAPDDGEHDYMGNITAGGQIAINGLPTLANDVEILKTDKQDVLVNQTNIKSINGNTLLGSGNLNLSTYQAFPNSWTTDGTISQLIEDVEADTNAVKGMAYLGEVTCSDLPFNGNAELVIEIMDGTSTSKVIVATLNSGTTSPYYWRYTYWLIGDIVHTSGWVSFQPLIDSSHKLSADLVTDTNTTNKFVTASDKITWSGKQDALTAGNNVTIETVNNVLTISATDTTYSNLSPAQGGTDVSLVSTGEKYIWNNKANTSIIADYTLSVANWVGNSYTLSITGKTASNNVLVSNSNTGLDQVVLDNANAIAEANIYKIVDNGTSITLTCEKVPTVDLIIQVEVFE